ncbi:unnamed protein product [Meloidogyne enterolobii]|uniref:Uncharacterized protein n=1 Tax=Meloidogyne enterolobii TaxID=390850 RepID=A0ACB0Z088_MELEN
MLVRCLLPMELETGPGTKKSSTLCSFLLVIATFLVLEVPGQSNNDGSVGVANHKLIGKKVTLVNYTIEANETNFNSDEYRMRIPNACDVKIDNDTIELQYNNSGCTVDLLIKNEDYNKKIKFKAGVRNKGGELKSCLKNAVHVKYSSNNIMPFVYSKNNKVVERLSHGPIYDHEDKCNKQQCGLCMPWTTLEISWSKSGRDVYAYTHLGKIKRLLIHLFTFVLSVGEVELGEKLRITQGGNEIVTFDMEVEGVGKFKMGPNSFKASKNVLCVPENNPIVEPETWTITNENLINRRLLVFSMLPVNASVGTHDGTKFAGTPPPGPHCNLFVQFVSFYITFL